MDHASPDYEAICVAELAAANRATSDDDRLTHLDLALRNALLASRSRRSATPVNLMHWRSQQLNKERSKT